MVPIKYVVDHWVYADISSKWYNYDNKEWANAVILNSGVTKNVGDEITENDIALWYVWIPRYKYTIFNGNNDAVNEQTINVEFESETATTGTVKCHDSLTTNNSSYSEICEDSTNHSIINGKSTYTHPAFCLGTKNNDGSCNGDELRGIWVGKFENSTTNSECLSSLAYSDASCNRTSTIIIKPNVPTWIYATLSRYFLSIRDISTTYGITNGDSHMMKNMEWGAVAYFKQSQYGLGITNVGVNNYHLTNNATNGYLFYKTGCGAEAGTANSAECNTYNTVNGMKASTTGNIYGVYDTNGGAGEMVMGNMISSSGGYNEGSSGLSGINAKYYDSYSYYYSTNQSYNPSQMHCRGKLGDATKETIKQFNTNTGAWYHIPQVENSGFSQFVGKHYWKINNKTSSSGDFMWLTRDNYPGNFGFVSCIGNVSEYASRSVLSKAN